MSITERKELLERASNLPEQSEYFVSGISTLMSENANLKQKIDRLTELLLIAQRSRFGQSSERRNYVLGGLDQVDILNSSTSEDNEPPRTATDDSVPEACVEVKGHSRKIRRKMEEIIENLPCEIRNIDIPENERFCKICGSELTYVGKKYIRTEIEVIPRQIKVVKYVIKTYNCKACVKESDHANFHSAPVPPALFPHSLASPSAVNDVMSQKYVYGLPLYRQEVMWKRSGFPLLRSTMANWMIQASEIYFKPIYNRLKNETVLLDVIHSDDTYIQVLKEPEKKASSQSHLWVYCSGRFCPRQIRLFEYSPDRKADNPVRFLGDFSGCLVTDGFSGFEKVSHAVLCRCWAHMRRCWRDAIPKGATGTLCKASVGFEYCNKLFALERDFADMTPEQRLAARREKSRPILDEYWAWVDSLDPIGGSKLSEAVTYARHQRDSLNEFMNHGDVEISNNIAENAIRPVVIGRKNWLFCDTVEGAKASAIIYSLVETAKANDLDPSKYLHYLLDGLRYHRDNMSDAVIESFLPWNPDVQAFCKA